MEPAADADPRGKRDPRDFALWKGHKAGEPDTASLADAVGPRPAGLAPGVLGDGRQVPGRRVRHPRRRPRPAVPAPRERAGPVDGGRAGVRPVLDAQRLGHRGRGEDEQVARQRRAGLGGDQALPAPGGPASIWPRRTTARRSSSPTTPWPRSVAALARIDSFVARADRAGRRRRPSRAGRVRRGDGRRPRHAGGGRRAVRGGPRRQRGAGGRRPRSAARAGSARSTGMLQSWAWTPTARPGPTVAIDERAARGGRRAGRPSCWSSAQAARDARTSPPPTRSATPWPSSGVEIADTPTGPAGRCNAGQSQD